MRLRETRYLIAETWNHSGWIAVPSMTNLRTYDVESAWHGPEMAARSDWIRAFTDEEIRELERAVDAVANREIIELRGSDFDLPLLDALLAQIRDDVVDGRGFALLRGLPVEEWSLERIACAYWAMGSRIGVPVSQNRVGNLLGHVTDVGGDAHHPNQRGHQSSDALAFHTDIGAEIVGLLCLRGARTGGESALVSAAALWNELVAERPDLAEVLTDTYYFDRRNEVVEGQKPWCDMPVFCPLEGHVVASFVPEFIGSAQRFEDVPQMTRRQEEALAKIKELANDSRFKLEMDFQPGDIQLVNNLVLLHSRTEYEDWPEAERRRHLLRLWLSVPDGWPIPDSFHARYGTDPETGRPRGINLPPGITLNAPLVPPVLRS